MSMPWAPGTCASTPTARRVTPQPRLPPCRQIAVPTTLSGAEFSDLGGCTDTRNGTKQGYTGTYIGAAAVILDPRITVHTPQRLWLSTGVRALDHAVESLCSINAQPLVDATSVRALALLGRALTRYATDPQDLDARLDAQMGAWLASMGIRRTEYGASHGLGHALGADSGVPHGITSCVLLPTVMRYNAEACAPQLAEVAAALGDAPAARGRPDRGPDRAPGPAHAHRPAGHRAQPPGRSWPTRAWPSPGCAPTRARSSAWSSWSRSWKRPGEHAAISIDIRAAAERLRGQVVDTPCLHSRTLSALCGCEVYLKFENHQFTASFKERGALNKMAQLTADERARGVLAVSAGNHAQGVAYHAQRMGVPATIVMPRFAPAVKVENTRRFGAEVVLAGDTFDDARLHGLRAGRGSAA